MKKFLTSITLAIAVFACGFMLSACKDDEAKIYDMSGVSMQDKSVIADGSAKTITVSGNLPSGVEATYEYYLGSTKLGGTPTENGVYTVVANFTGEGKYEPINSMSATLTIYNGLSSSDVEENALTISESGYYALTSDIVADATVDLETGEDVVDVVVVLNLNGYTLTNYSTHTLTNNATLTIMDSNINNENYVGGIIDNVTHGKAAVYNNGTITIDNGTFTRSEEHVSVNSGVYQIEGEETRAANSWYLIYNNVATMTINGGKYYTWDKGYSYTDENEEIQTGWYGNSSSLIYNAITNRDTGVVSTLIINGGEFVNSAVVVKNEDYSSLTINGGHFTMDNTYLGWYGGNDAILNAGNLVITGGSIELLGTGASEITQKLDWGRVGIYNYAGYETTANISNLTLYTEGEYSFGIYLCDSTLTIESGTYIAQNGADYLLFIESQSAVFTINGGNFSCDESILYLAYVGGTLEINGGDFTAYEGKDVYPSQEENTLGGNWELLQTTPTDNND